MPPLRMVTVAALKRRGWTDALIRDHLGEPDKMISKPHCRSIAAMRLYRVDRVKAAETSDQWAAAFERTQQRKASAKQGVETKRQQMIAHLDTVKIEVPDLPLPTLFQRACDHYNRRGNRQQRQDVAVLDSDPFFLNRIAVNYLRHILTPYEAELERVVGRVGVKLAYVEINRKVYTAIGEAYPSLRPESDRQLAAKVAHHQRLKFAE